MKTIIERIFCRTCMQIIWTGAIVMGLVYLVGFGATKESLPFIVGQIVLGVFGLLREYQLYMIKPSLTPSIWKRM